MDKSSKKLNFRHCGGLTRPHTLFQVSVLRGKNVSNVICCKNYVSYNDVERCKNTETTFILHKILKICVHFNFLFTTKRRVFC